MSDSGNNPPVERKRADPLQVAADMLSGEGADEEQSTSGQRHAPETRSPSSGESRAESSDDSPKARRAAARAARQEALEKRRAERAAAKDLASRRRGGDDRQENPKSLAEKLDEAREAVSTPPDREEPPRDEDDPTPTITWSNAPTASDFSDEPASKPQSDSPRVRLRPHAGGSRKQRRPASAPLAEQPRVEAVGRRRP